MNGVGAAIGTNNGRYTTDRNGLITITGLQPGQILIVTEEKAPNGYVLDMTPKTIKIKQGVANSLIFENARAGSLVINKYSALDRKTPLEGVTFKITTTSGEFLPDENGKISSNGLYYTDETGQIIINSIVGSLVVTEQDTISGVTFLLYDSANKPIGQYTTDNTGYIYIEDLTVPVSLRDAAGWAGSAGRRQCGYPVPAHGGGAISRLAAQLPETAGCFPAGNPGHDALTLKIWR